MLNKYMNKLERQVFLAHYVVPGSTVVEALTGNPEVEGLKTTNDVSNNIVTTQSKYIILYWVASVFF